MIFWKKTQKGRIVYYRKKHFFGANSIGRIVSDTGAVATIFLGDKEFDKIISKLFGDLDDLEQDVEFSFGGGEFGGGGVVRPFSESLENDSEERKPLEEEIALTFVPPKIENIIVIMKPVPWRKQENG